MYTCILFIPTYLEVDKIGLSRDILIKALTAEGISGVMEGYTNLHLLPLFQKIAYGSKGFPWNSDICKRNVNYDRGICPVAEELHEKTFLVFLCACMN